MPILAPETGTLIMQRVEELALISESNVGLTRRFATPEHRRANQLATQWMELAGMHVHEDAIGNVIGRYEGDEPLAPAIMLGSHLDTVVMAGKYDGMLGVLSGLACVEYLAANNRRLPYAIEVIGFADEEGVRYQSTFLGSRALTGELDTAMLELTDKDGISMSDALVAFGKDPSQLPTAIREPGSLAAFIEVHIEQGPVLEQQELGVGVVSAIAGATRMIATITGEAGHAGTVPMSLRRDALAAAAECILVIERLCSGPADLVGTVGRIVADPGAGNVISGQTEFSIDIRAADDSRRLQAVAEVVRELKKLCANRQLQIHIEEVHNAGSVECDTGLRRHIGDAVASCGLRTLELTSGAGHDTMVMAHIAPAGLIFVRCAGGISHNPAESIMASDAALGAEVMMQTVLNFSQQ
ncbi:MAG: allantoate deiminase [bacterium]|jgi:allantoate deiminase